jgi:hypothetical protein
VQREVASNLCALVTNDIANSVSSRGGQGRSYSSVVVSSGPAVVVSNGHHVAVPTAEAKDGCGLFTMVSSAPSISE